MPLSLLFNLQRLLPSLVAIIKYTRAGEKEKAIQETFQAAAILYEASIDRNPKRRAKALDDMSRRTEPMKAIRKPRRTTTPETLDR